MHHSDQANKGPDARNGLPSEQRCQEPMRVAQMAEFSEAGIKAV